MDIEQHLDTISGIYESQIEHLKEELNKRDARIEWLEDKIFKYLGLVKDDTKGLDRTDQATFIPRNSREQREFIERRLRNPEVQSREEYWRKKVEETNLEEKQDAS